MNQIELKNAKFSQGYTKVLAMSLKALATHHERIIRGLDLTKPEAEEAEQLIASLCASDEQHALKPYVLADDAGNFIGREIIHDRTANRTLGIATVAKGKVLMPRNHDRVETPATAIFAALTNYQSGDPDKPRFIRKVVFVPTNYSIDEGLKQLSMFSRIQKGAMSTDFYVVPEEIEQPTGQSLHMLIEKKAIKI